MNFTTLKLNLELNAKQKQVVTIKGFYEGEKIPLAGKFLGTTFGDLTTIPNLSTTYLCLGEKSALNLKKIQQLFDLLINSRFYQANYDLTTFQVAKMTIEQIVKVFLETLLENRFPHDNHKTKKTPQKPLNVNIIAKIDQTTFKTLVDQQLIIAKYFNLCRNLQNEAPNIMFPAEFAKRIESQVAKIPNLKIEIWNEKKIAAENMNLFLSVAAGSANLPRLVKLTYSGAPKSKFQTALIGKGITFDTGGYSLKPSQYQKDMKYDMSGAAIVCTTLLAIAQLKLPVNITTLACLSENLIGKKATLVESVIKSKSGLTVEITNTDAEGRLVLADAITYAFNDLKVNQTIELSTLTGAITVTLGNHITGAFTNNAALYQEFKRASEITHEPIWQLPVVEYNHKLMHASLIADLINASSDYHGGASNAAAFLFAFAKKKPFLHLDIAGTATTPSAVKQATAVMLKTLIVYFQNQLKKK